MASAAGTRTVRAIAPTTASAPRANSTDNIRIPNRPSPAISRHAASAQKYSGGCTSVAQRARDGERPGMGGERRAHVARTEKGRWPNGPRRRRGDEDTVAFVILEAAHCRRAGQHHGGEQQDSERFTRPQYLARLMVPPIMRRKY